MMRFGIGVISIGICVSIGMYMVAESVYGATNTITGYAQEQPEIQFRPPQLFDIDVSLERAVINSIADLVAKVHLSSYGYVPTPVEITTVVRDYNGEIVFQTQGETIVETENIYTQLFPEIALPAGTYTIHITTQYHMDMALRNVASVPVQDSFEVPFTIVSTDIKQPIKASPFWEGVKYFFREMLWDFAESQVAGVAMVHMRLNDLVDRISEYIIAPKKNLRTFANLSSVRSLAHGTLSAQAKQDFVFDARSVMEMFSQYAHIGFVDMQGRVVADIERGKRGEIRTVSKDSTTYDDVYKDMIANIQSHDVGQVFLLDSTTTAHDTHSKTWRDKEVFYYGMVVADDDGNKSGVVFMGIYTKPIMTYIRRFKRNGEFAVLIDNSGKYIFGVNDVGQQASNAERNFLSDYPFIHKDDLRFTDKKEIETEDAVFLFEKIWISQEQDNALILVVVTTKGLYTQMSIIQIGIFFLLTIIGGFIIRALWQMR